MYRIKSIILMFVFLASLAVLPIFHENISANQTMITSDDQIADRWGGRYNRGFNRGFYNRGYYNNYSYARPYYYNSAPYYYSNPSYYYYSPYTSYDYYPYGGYYNRPGLYFQFGF